MKIDRRTFLKSGCAAAASLTLSKMMPSLFAGEQGSRPNVLVILADQLGLNCCGYSKYWGGANYAGAEQAVTPNIDQFSRQGINFVNTVASSPVCSAYRATLMTGKYTTSHGMVINELRLNPYQDCLGHSLTRNGYSTAYIGKWHMYANALGDHLNADNSFVPQGPHRLGFNGFWAAYNFHHEYYNTYYHTTSKKKIFWDPGVYEPDGQTDMAINWMKCHSQKSTRPFSMVLSWGTPHDPWNDANVPAQYRDIFKNANIPNPPNYLPENDAYADSWAQLTASARSSLAAWRKNYYAMTTNLDWNFGRIMQFLETSGLAENTIVIFSSDHGEMFGAQGRRAKNIFYEEAARIPFLVRWPAKIASGLTSDACMSSVDIMPTILGLLDLPVPSRVEGMDLSHLARGQSGPEPEFAMLQNTGACAAWQDGYEWRAVRNKQYTYARYRRDGKELLFDNLNDPYQLNDLSQDSGSQGVLLQLRNGMQAKMDSLSDTFAPSTYYRDHWTDGNRVILRGARG